MIQTLAVSVNSITIHSFIAKYLVNKDKKRKENRKY